MTARAFVVMQVGSKGSRERKRADEVFKYVVGPALAEFKLEAYRSDLDPSPGGITPKMLTELVSSELVIADLSGRNPNVFYELGIAHSFAKPLISLADAVSQLPFDAKDERVIEIGEVAESGLGMEQGEQAKRSLLEALRVVRASGYTPPSPLREAAANRSLDELAPENPVAAELAAMRETLEEIRTKIPARRVVPPTLRADIAALRQVVEDLSPLLSNHHYGLLSTANTSENQAEWVTQLREDQRRTDRREARTKADRDPWSTNDNDPWSTPASTSDEPPF